MSFEIQGHRGARGLYPENTLKGFAGAIRLGVDAIELDVGLTADGVPVVFHDVTLSPDIVRGPDGLWLTRADIALHTLTVAELREYDVGRLRPGSAYAARHPDQKPHDGARIPVLEDVLRLALRAGVRVDIELKTRPDRPELTATAEAMADAVMRVVDRAGAAGAVDLRSFDWRGLIHLGRTRPEIPLTWLTSPLTRHFSELWWMQSSAADPVAAIQAVCGDRPRAKVDTWAPEFDELSQDDVSRGRAAGLRVIPWTVNTEADMRRLVAWGADGVCTDRPDLARGILFAHGLTLPQAGGRGAVDEPRDGSSATARS